MMFFDTTKEAAQEWVSRFNAIPETIVEKLINAGDEIMEITPPSLYDRVCIMDDEHFGMEGEVVQTYYDNNPYAYLIKTDDHEEICVSRDYLEVEQDNFLPMWGTMWTFDERIDEDFFTDNIQEMADCGFRIYQHDDLGLIFGIDGAGYDFYEKHWIPLYKARGLHWSKEDMD